MSNTIVQFLCRFSIMGRHKSSLCTCVFEQAFFLSVGMCNALVLALYNMVCYISVMSAGFMYIMLVTVTLVLLILLVIYFKVPDCNRFIFVSEN
jgi:hypothetical protein